MGEREWQGQEASVRLGKAPPVGTLFSHVPGPRREAPFFSEATPGPPGLRALMKIRDRGGIYGASAQRRQAWPPRSDLSAHRTGGFQLAEGKLRPGRRQFLQETPP